MIILPRTYATVPFNLVKYWGGVPLKTDKNITEWNIPKSSKEEVYNFIIEDLK